MYKKIFNFFPILILFTLNLYQFYPHYFLDDCIFPGDFVQSYYYMSYIWLKMFDWISLPTWNPYGSLGYPEHLAIQSGAFYPPLMLIKLLNIEYAIHVATILQCLHVFAGSLGVYLLLKNSGRATILALLGGVAYALSTNFFSNAIHTDIIRAYGVVPFIFLFLEPNKTLTRTGFIGLFISSFCLLSGGYPGIIISAFYIFIFFILFNLINLDKKQRINYLLLIFLSSISCLFLMIPKYLPSILLGYELDFIPSAPYYGRASLYNLFTIIFPYTSDKIPGDLTMKSLYLFPVLFIFTYVFFFLDSAKKNILPYVVTLICSFIFITDNSISDLLYQYLPQLKTSRFALAGFRPFFHIAIIQIGIFTIEHYKNDSSKYKLVSIILAILSLYFLYLIGIYLAGFSIEENLIAKYQIYFSILTIALFLLFQRNNFLSKFKIPEVLLILFCLYNSFKYTKTQNIAYSYQVCGYEQIVYNQYKFSFTNFYDNNDNWQTSWKERPARTQADSTIFGTGNIDMISQKFSANGYNAGAKITKVLDMLDSRNLMEGVKSNHPYIQFLMEKSSILFISENDKIKVLDCLKNNSCKISEIKLNEFKESSITYDVNLTKSGTLIENEMYYDGWKAKTSDGKKILAFTDESNLRQWKLPAGKYQLITYYEPPKYKLSLLIGFLGIIISILSLWYSRRILKN